MTTSEPKLPTYNSIVSRYFGAPKPKPAAKITKKAFREYLNAQPELNDAPDRRGGLTGARTRLYGDWLYSADKDMFDELYRQHLAAAPLPTLLDSQSHTG